MGTESHGQLWGGRKDKLIRRAKGTFNLLLRKAAQLRSIETEGATESDNTGASQDVDLLVEAKKVNRLTN